MYKSAKPVDRLIHKNYQHPDLEGARKISQFITTVDEMINLSSYVSKNISEKNCTNMIPTLAEAYCKKRGK